MARNYRKDDVGEGTIDDNEVTTPNLKNSWFILKTLGLILLYFALSIGLTFYQRALLKDLHFPLSVALSHFTLKFMLAAICRALLEWYTGWPRLHTPWKRYVTRLAPIGIASGLDVGLSNWGLELIRVSLYTMTKSTTIVFILIFALVFKLERKSWALVLIVGLIASGLTMFTYKATEFNTLGFVLVIVASFTSGVRWTLAQLWMQQSEAGHQNPLDMVYHVQPWMILSLLPFAAYIEGPQVASSCLLLGASDVHAAMGTLSKVGVGALIAFAMELSEYLVVVNTSSLTLSIAGVFKEVATVVLAVEWAGDQMSTINVVGLVVCVGGISAHVVHKMQSAKLVGSPVRSPPSTSDNDNFLHYEMREPLLSDGTNISTAFLVSGSEEEDSDETTDILYVLGQRDRPQR